MFKNKDYYKNIAPKGFEWVGVGEFPYTHLFQSGNYSDGFIMINCSEDCLTNGNLEFLCKNKMSFDTKTLKKLSKKIELRIKKLNNIS